MAEPERGPERPVRFETLSGIPIEPLYTPESLHGVVARREARPSRRVPVHPRRLSDDVPGPALDDADVRRLRPAGGHERPLQVPARAGTDRALDRVRHARADGLRRRSPAGARRGRQGRRVDLDPGRLRAAVRGHPARRRHDVDDDQLHGVGRARDVPGRRREAGRAVGPRRRHDAERHAEGVHRPEGMDLSARSGRADRRRHDRVHVRSTCRASTRSRSRGYHIREAGATAVQELAFTLADGLGYVEAACARGPRRRQLRAAALVLLRHPQRLLRGDRQAPRGARASGRGS